LIIRLRTGAASAAAIIDRSVCWLGRAVSWLCLAMVLLTGLVVALRYVFDLGWIWMQELVTWMHAAVFMLAAAYTLSRDEHVRVDIFYRRLSARGRAVVDTAGVALLLLPTCGWILYTGLDYVTASWRMLESSRETGGMPGLFLLKTLIVVTPILLALEGVAVAIRAWLAPSDPAIGKQD
jgi:TRAP-type mannitol/chloroaromatic compound transport system permease small subunit